MVKCRQYIENILPSETYNVLVSGSRDNYCTPRKQCNSNFIKGQEGLIFKRLDEIEEEGDRSQERIMEVFKRLVKAVNTKGIG